MTDARTPGADPARGIQPPAASQTPGELLAPQHAGADLEILQGLELAEAFARNGCDGVAALDRDLRVIYGAAALERLWHVTTDELVPLLTELGELPNVRLALAGTPAVSIIRTRGAGYQLAYRPLRQGDAIVGVAVAIRDTARHCDLEQALTETERRFQNMADAAPVLLWMSRPDSLCTFFNQSWLAFTGRTLEQEWGIGWAEGVHSEDLQRCLDTYIDAFNARQVFEMEYRLRRANGEYRWILDRGTPRYSADGTFAGFIGSCVDITEHRVMEQELRAALAVKDRFLGLVSHEMRTPLTVFQLVLERLRTEDSDRLSAAQRELIGRMAGASDRLAQTIESVLQLSRVEGGHLRVDRREVDVGSLIEVIVDELRPSAERKGLVTTVAASRVPPLVSDPELIRLIVSNLVTNAIKFTDAGSVAISLSYRDGHRIEVTDTGRGIESDSQRRIFEPFEQLEPSRKKHNPGVGLGLALVKALSAALGAHVELTSRPGSGSTFAIVFPPPPQVVDG